MVIFSTLKSGGAHLSSSKDFTRLNIFLNGLLNSVCVGIGRKTLFWNDVWLHKVSPLKIMYKDLFDICSNPNGRVAEYVEDEDYVQDPSLVVPSRQWQDLFSELNSYNISESQPDRVTLGFGKEWHLFH